MDQKIVYLIRAENKGREPNLYFINFKDQEGTIEIAKTLDKDIVIVYEVDQEINSKFKEIWRKEKK